MTFLKLLGQKRADKILGGFLASGRVPSALLFCGPEGVGKTLAAREFAKALLCREKPLTGEPACGFCADCRSIDNGIHPDALIIDANYQANLREEDRAKQKTLRVETIRHLRKDMEMRSMLGGWKIAVVVDAHTLEIEAANALLKILEEPQPQTLWILTTTQKERLPRTIASRCFTAAFAPLAPAVIARILAAAHIAPDLAARLATVCEGSAARALELSHEPAGLPSEESLPKELYRVRTHVERGLRSLAEELRARLLAGQTDFNTVEAPLKTLVELRRALRSNADPRLILMIARAQAEKVSV